MRHERHLLNNQRAKIEINRDDFKKIHFSAKDRLLPVGDINKIVNVAERFDYERQNSSYYRINGTINTLFNNSLFNTTGTNSWETFMGPIFRDRSYPPDGIDLDQEEDLTYRESIELHLKEIDGWYGFNDPNIASFNPCIFTDMEPNRELFSLSPIDNQKNWELTVTYPYASEQGLLTMGGLLIIDKKEVSISGRRMTAFGVATKHNLTQGSTVKISGMTPSNFNGEFIINRLGLDNGDLKLYYFCVDLDPSGFSLGLNSRMTRIFNGQASNYYYRKFKKIKTRSTLEMEDDDYEIYPLAFSNNIYNDKISQFIINEDIDVSGLVDNLKRPLSEIYITFIKKNNKGFTNVASGVEMPYIDSVANNINVPDIRRISNDILTHTPINNSVNVTDTDFFGDIVEYNRYELNEIVLAEAYHRFNTINRDEGGFISDPISSDVIDAGKRYEGYMYKPHKKIKIRAFSSYIEQGDSSVAGIPNYAEDLGDGRYLWRDLMDIGFNDVQETLVDYPFLNGSHYIHVNMLFPLKRQDPFGKYGLFYSAFPRDYIGNTLPDNYIIKKVDDVC